MSAGQGAARSAPAPGSAPRRGASGVYELLRAQIISGELKAGEALTETALAAAAGVSRTPIREALRRLEQDGLVEHSTHGGLRVRRRSVEEILEIYDVRIVLEAEAAREAAERRNRADVLRLTELLERMAGIPVGAAEEMASANAVFHHAIWRASHNATLIDVLERLDVHLRRYPATTYIRPDRWETAQAQHREIVAAIESRDEETAARVAGQHIADSRDVRIAIWREHPELMGDVTPLA